LAQAGLSFNPIPHMTVETQFQLSYFDPIEFGIKGIGRDWQSPDLFRSGFIALHYEL
jgi:hypothetical protein